jgi:hypothetical protein
MPEMEEMAQALSHRSNTCCTGKDKARVVNILGSRRVLSRAFASNHRRKGSEERARVMALSRHLWSLFPPEFYPQTLTYITVLEYHRIPYNKRFREDAEHIPLISAFL